jgi:SAM-dependent methyltransferase
MENKSSSYYHNSRSELKLLIPCDVKKVLEVGCGEGAFRKHFSDDVEYVGVEPNAKSAKMASSVFSTVFVGTIESAECNLPNNYYELAVANDVIEHSVDHNEFLRIVRAKLKHKSHFIGSIPNIRSFESLYNLLIRKDWKYTESGVLDYTHLRYFTKLSLERTLEDAGFIDISVRPINKILPNGKLRFLKAIIINLLQLFLGPDIGYAQLAFSCRKGSV